MTVPLNDTVLTSVLFTLTVIYCINCIKSHQQMLSTRSLEQDGVMPKIKNNTSNYNVKFDTRGGLQRRTVHEPACSFSGKVFCIGLFKTGTSSCGELLNDLGYRCVGKTCRFLWFHANLMWDDHAAKEFFTIKEISKNVELYEDLYHTMSTNDGPWLFMFEELKRHFPNSRFIYTQRDIRDLVNSDIQHFWVREGKETFDEIVHMKPRRGDLAPVAANMAVVRRYHQHRKRVFDFFIGSNTSNTMENEFLEIDFTSSNKHQNVRGIIERFLGCPESHLPMPHKNANNRGFTEHITDDYWQFLNTYEQYDFSTITESIEPRHLITNQSVSNVWIESGKNVMDAIM